MEAARIDLLRQQEWLQKAKDRIVKPIESARVVVRVRVENLPKDLDLDIYVEDPENEICFWKKPRVMSLHSERATLIPSEALRFARLSGNQSDSTNIEEETYYASEPLAGEPYLVFFMVREKSPQTEFRRIELSLNWELIIKDEEGKSKIHKGNDTLKCLTGGIIVDSSEKQSRELFHGLTPLFGFDVDENSTQKVDFVVRKKMPALPRSFKHSKGSGKRVKKQTD